MQDNDLVTTSDLRDLTALRKLDLEGNALQSLTGLGALTNLTDLHVSRQRLPPGACASVLGHAISWVGTGQTSQEQLCHLYCVAGKPLSCAAACRLFLGDGAGRRCSLVYQLERTQGSQLPPAQHQLLCTSL